MTLDELIADLLTLQVQGHGKLLVFYRHSASGDCGPVWGGNITSLVDDHGPFDIPNGSSYVEIIIGGN